MSSKTDWRSNENNKLSFLEIKERNRLGKLADRLGSRANISLYWENDANDTEVVGDANANGTSVYSSTVAAYSTLYITSMSYIASAMAMMVVGTGALASLVILHRKYLSGAGEIMITADGDFPVLVIDNSTGSTALTWRCVVPQTFGGAATNNAATKYFHFSYAGLEVKENEA